MSLKNNFNERVVKRSNLMMIDVGHPGVFRVKGQSGRQEGLFSWVKKETLNRLKVLLLKSTYFPFSFILYYSVFFLAPFFQQLLSWLESFKLLACITFWKMDLTRPSYLKFNQQNKLLNKPATYQYYDGQVGKDSVQCTHFFSFFGQHYKLSSVERGI